MALHGLCADVDANSQLLNKLAHEVNKDEIQTYYAAHKDEFKRIAWVKAHNLAAKKKEIIKANYDKTGKTIPASAIHLAMDAERKYQHSRMLASNINKANPGQKRPAEVDAHHIVGRIDFRAVIARGYLFAWGIAINDADNGCYLPRYRQTLIASMPNALKHRSLHTDDYYFNVTVRLADVLGQTTNAARIVLRKIKAELISGEFEY